MSHLEILAREPRPAGGDAEGRAREYAAEVLREAGFEVRLETFGYSTFPGRYGTPIGGVLGALAILGAAWAGSRTGATWQGLATLMIGLGITAAYTRALLGDAVLDLPVARARSENLVATRGAEGWEPRVWLVAHLDSKSQPVPSLGRIAGVVLMALAAVAALGMSLLQLDGAAHRTGWWAAVALAVAGAPLVLASVVGADSDGAVDNASGVAAVLLAAQRVHEGIALGVLLPSAEELGLAGARGWARARAATAVPGVALNCDGVDDDGELTIMYSGARPDGTLLAALGASGPGGTRVRRMPLGMLTDSVALADRGWRTVTVSRGGLRTLRRVHSRADSLRHLRGDGIEPTATLLARAVEALA